MCSQPISATEDAPGQITITYDTNIKIGGAVGFAVSLCIQHFAFYFLSINKFCIGPTT
jgi:hypothetical protein